MARDNHLLRFGLSQEPRQVVLDLGKRDFLHFGFAYRANHDSASNLGTIANTSTVAPETS
jgi:hypothetical protein